MGAKADVERVMYEGRELAIMVPAGYRSDGISFFTDPAYSQQLAYMRRPAGYNIDAHVHNDLAREVRYTLETLIVRSGRVRLDLYGDNREFVRSLELGAGDIVLLASGGHGITVLEEAEIVEVKQGPYAGDEDKTRFSPPAATGQ